MGWIVGYGPAGGDEPAILQRGAAAEVVTAERETVHCDERAGGCKDGIGGPERIKCRGSTWVRR